MELKYFFKLYFNKNVPNRTVPDETDLVEEEEN